VIALLRHELNLRPAPDALKRITLAEVMKNAMNFTGCPQAKLKRTEEDAK
jgi:hypothetical protein